MYRLLIVDDEYQIVDWLYELFRGIPYLDLDICKAYSGSEALEWLNRTKIDIVITDICMPGIDGLELADRIYKNWPFCKLIFLTGYDEFDFIYEAVKYDGVSYLLKNEDDEELIKAVEKAIRDIDKSYVDKELIDKARQQMHMAIPVMQKEYMQDLLIESIFEPEITQERFTELALPMSVEKPVLIILGSIDNFLEKIGTPSKLTECMYVVRLLWNQCFSDFKNKFFVEYNKSSFILLIQQESKQEDSSDSSNNTIRDENLLVLAKGRLETIQSVYRESLGLTLSFIIGCGFISWDHAAEKVSYLKQLLDNCAGMGKEILITENNFPESIRGKISIYDDSIEQSISQLKKIDALNIYLENGRKNEFFRLLDSILGCLAGIKSKNYSPALEIYFSISTFLLSYINKKMLTEKVAFRIGLHKLTLIQEHANWEDEVQYIYQLCEILFDIQENEQNKIEADSIYAVREYIDEHLNEDLSLAELSEMVYFNSSYFSRKFKQETGKNLSEYINDARIVKAKNLLEETNMKIQDIAINVGYKSSTYFSYCFKKATGVSPTDYRKTLNK